MIFFPLEEILRFEGCSNNLFHLWSLCVVFLECGQTGNVTESSLSNFLVEFYKSPDEVPSLLTASSIAYL